MRKILFILLISLAGGAVIGAVLSALMPGGFTFAGFIGTAALAWLCLFFLVLSWQWGGRGKMLAWMMALAFALRLILGAGLSLALPVYGYDTPTQNAGYIFLDAMQRDQQAWDLAQSGGTIIRAFGSEFFTDQYGGMLAVSAGIYRLFSPDAHSPWLILILTAAFGSLGVPFLRKVLGYHFSPRITDTAVWIFVLYPESILLGAAQMRDPILIGLTAIAFWGALALPEQRKTALAALIGSLVVMAVFSWLVAVPVLAVLLIMIWVREKSRYSARVRRLVWAGILAVGVVGLVAIGSWLRESAVWDAQLTEQGSGWLQLLLQNKPRLFKLVFLVVYGLAQPVLPAAIFDPSLPLWNGITTFRSLGWYLLAPLLLYFPFGLKNEPRGDRKNLLITVYVASLLWIIVSSLRAGGDLWDNPRYRTFFIAWLVLAAAWSWVTARESKDAWLLRWFGVEAVFLVIFSFWYANRTFAWGLPIPFYGMVGVIVLLAAVILLSGAIADRRRRVPA